MTFEEFLIKKKIDPVQLQDADQDFFDEFKSHFNEMGEKSFDHSKKFWFNKLRRANPLAEEVKILAVAETLEAPQAKAHDSVAEVLEASSFETHKAPVAEALEAKPTFKPRFKANITASKTEVKNNQVEETATPEPEASKPTDTAKTPYKPRFKAPAKPANELQDKDLEIVPQKEIVDPKPAYRPRFKAGIVKKEEEGG
jgi:hypothetical protein